MLSDSCKVLVGQEFMILKKDKVGWLGGVVVSSRETRLVFDPVPSRTMEHQANVFISHAHSDHTYGFSSRAAKYSTRSTRQIHETLRRREVKNHNDLHLHRPIRFGDMEVTPLNAGHMLGSIQFRIRTNELTVVYTGDLNCVDTLTTSAADELACDCLVLEATYGHPSYVFPRRQRTYAEIVAWTMEETKADRVPTFQVYSAGKAQEIVRLFNEYTHIPVVCHPSICGVNRTYGENGIRLEYVDALSEEGLEMLEHDACVFVTTTGSGGPVPARGSRAVATGWAMRVQSRNCVSFPLSSHADFNMLSRFVRATKAKTVFAFTGFTDVFCEYLRRRLGVDARPLPLLHQTKIVDFQNG